MSAEQDIAGRAYESMFATAKEQLKGRDPAETARLAGGRFFEGGGAAPVEGVLLLEVFGRPVRLAWPELSADPPLPNWAMLVLLHYLSRADGTAPSGERIALSGMIDGLIRGTKFDLTAERSLQRMLKGRTREDILAAFAKLGAKQTEGKADIDLVVPLLPLFPVYVSVYFADEDFPASGKLFADKTADHFLSIEDAVTVGDLILREAEKAIDG